jgi:hypothetical protein
MGRVVLLIVVAILVVVIGGAVWLMTANVPAPVRHVEQVIPNGQLGR